MDIIKISNGLYEEYENLLMERDEARKKAGQVWTVYLKLFGQLMTEVFEEKLECVKRKKAISYCQYALNHSGQLSSADLNAYLQRELAALQQHLEALREDAKRGRESQTSTAYEVERSRTLYRRVAKLLHPDAHPETDQSERLRQLWQRAVIAYGANNVKELAEIEVLARRALKELGLSGEAAEIPDLKDRIGELRREIEQIYATEPYIHIALVNDEAAVARKQQALRDELAEYQKYRAQLDEVLSSLTGSGLVVLP